MGHSRQKSRGVHGAGNSLLLVGADTPRLETRIARFEEAEWPSCDLVNASFSLPLCTPAAFPALWARIVRSLRTGGRFCGQFYGVRDEWASGGLVTLTRTEVDRLLAPFEVELLEEWEDDGTTALGSPKHWHLFHVVARKR